MRPKRITTESLLAESSVAEQRTEGSSSANGSALAYMLDTRRERTATEIMLYGWLTLRPISNREREYWNTHLLPSGCSIIEAPNADISDRR